MKLLKTLSLMMLALIFTLVLSCSQKSTSEESEATDETEVVEPAKTMDAAIDSTAMDMADSLATEVTDSASMEN